MEIKNSTHSNEKILILKQSAKFKTYSKKYIFLSLYYKYYIPKCFVNRLKEKTKCFET